MKKNCSRSTSLIYKENQKIGTRNWPLFQQIGQL